jgi:hypothetical protein
MLVLRDSAQKIMRLSYIRDSAFKRRNHPTHSWVELIPQLDRFNPILWSVGLWILNPRPVRFLILIPAFRLRQLNIKCLSQLPVRRRR